MANKRKKAQIKLVNELQNQVMVQAERLGIRDQYTPTAMEELSLDAVRKILTELYMERSNLEYELNILGSNKKEILIKLERLNLYVRRAEALRNRHLDKYSNLLEKSLGDQDKTRKAVKNLKPVKVQAAA
jgi:hypothetical protein